MPTLPSEQARPTPRFGGPLRAPEVVDTSVSRLGESISGFGEVMVREKIKDDKYRVEDAYTKLQQMALDQRKGENGYTNVRAGDVDKKFFQDRLKLFEDGAKEIENSLDDDDQKKMFSRRYEAAKIGFSENLIDHITNENNVFKAQTYKGGVDTDLDIASSDYDDENKVNIALLHTKNITETEADRLGLKGDARKMLLKENTSNIHESVIKQAVDDGNYDYAKTWFEKNQKNILGERQDEIKSLLRESGIKERSIEAVDSYVYEGLTESEAKAEARKLPPELRDATNARIEERYADAAQIRDREQRAAGEAARSIYAETGNLDDVPISILREMDGQERIALQDKAKLDAKGEDIPNGGVDYYKLRLMARKDPISFRNANPFAYKLSETDRKEIIKLQTDEKEINYFNSEVQLVDQAAVAAGFDPKDRLKDNKSGEKIRGFYERVRTETEAYQLTTGKKPDDKALQGILDRLTIQVIRDPNAWYFTGERAAVSAEIEGVPTSEIDELAAAVRRAGQPVTDENIQLLYRYLQK